MQTSSPEYAATSKIDEQQSHTLVHRRVIRSEHCQKVRYTNLLPVVICRLCVIEPPSRELRQNQQQGAPIPTSTSAPTGRGGGSFRGGMNQNTMPMSNTVMGVSGMRGGMGGGSMMRGGVTGVGMGGMGAMSGMGGMGGMGMGGMGMGMGGMGGMGMGAMGVNPMAGGYVGRGGGMVPQGPRGGMSAGYSGGRGGGMGGMGKWYCF